MLLGITALLNTELTANVHVGLIQNETSSDNLRYFLDILHRSTYPILTCIQL